MKKTTLIFVIIFIAICLVPSIGMLVLGESQPVSNEIITQKPKITNPDKSFNIDFLKDTSNYFEKRFALRPELITMQSKLYAMLFNQSTVDDVTIGKKDWLFFTETVSEFHGERELSDLEIKLIGKNLAMISEYAATHGAEFFFTVAPNKISLYPQFYSSDMESLSKNIDNVQKELDLRKITYIDLFSPIAKSDEVFYYKLDSHWNQQGAAIAHDAIVTELDIGAELWSQRSGTYTHTHDGDLYKMLYPAGSDKDFDFLFDDEFMYKTKKENVRADDIIIETKNENAERSLLMFRDSFGNSLYPFMAESFREAYFSRSNPYTVGIFEERSFDFIVIEIAQRNLSWLSKNAPVMPSPKRDISIENMQSGSDYGFKALLSEEESELAGYIKISGEIFAKNLLTSMVSFDKVEVLIGASNASDEYYEASLTIPNGSMENSVDSIGFTTYIEEDFIDENGRVEEIIISLGDKLFEVEIMDR